MRHLTLLFGTLIASCCAAPLLADTTSLQSILINANGTQYTNENSVPGVNTGKLGRDHRYRNIDVYLQPWPRQLLFRRLFRPPVEPAVLQ